MENKKRKILSSILNGKIKVENSLNEYNDLLERATLDMDYQSKVENKYNLFLINLYNYVRAIKNQCMLFEKYDKVEAILNKTIVPKSWKQYPRNYTFFELYNAFRNKKEHPDKINSDDEYVIFKTSIEKEEFLNLYHICNEILNIELNKLGENDVVNFFMSNVEFKTLFESLLINMIDVNEKNKAEYPLIYKLNLEMIEQFKQLDFDNMTFKEIDSIWRKIELYWKNEDLKSAFVNRYGIDMYDRYMEISDEDSTIDEYKIKTNQFLQDLCDIDRNKQENQ